MAYSRGRGRLQYWLDLRKISQAELSRRSGWSEENPDIGWSPRMISHFCQNKKAMPIEAVYTFGVILNIPDPLVDLFESWNWEGNGDAPSRR